MQSRYIPTFSWFLLLYALVILAFSGMGEEKFEHLHLLLDISNAILSLLLMLFLLGEQYQIQTSVRKYLSIGFGFAAATELLHALIGIEWSGWFAWIQSYSGTLRPATWPPSTYVLPLALAWTLWLTRRKPALRPALFATGIALLTAGLIALSLALPRYVDTGILGIQRPTQVPLLLLWAGVIAAYWRERHTHPLYEGLALMGVVLFLSDLCMLYSTSPHEKFTMMAHVGKTIAYTLLHVIQMRIAAEDSRGRSAAESSLFMEKERLRATIDTSMDAVVQIDAEGIITGWNSQTEKIFGWARAEAVGRAIHETVIPPQHRKAHMRGMKHFLLTGEGPILNKRIEIVGLHRDGHEFPIELTVAPIKMEGKYEFSAFIRDITKEKESAAIIWKQANFDLLTGLPNRHMLHDRMEQEIKKAKRANLKIALLLIDLDRFKEINDTLGHDMGDLLLIEAARRITGCVRTTDIVARFGGDEFTVLLAETDDVSSIERVAQNIIQSLAAVFRLKGEASYVSASIGVTLYPDDADTIEGLLKNADQAMYAAKEQGRNRHSYFTRAMQEAAQTKLRLVNDLRGALAANQFMVYFQPILELATGNIHKAEALIRWQHPERGMVSPVEFIPLAEETGLIFEIGDWVFHESMHWAKRWRTLYNPELQISVNKSPMQFYKDGDNHTAWLAYLRKLDLPGQSLAIEITEGLLLDSNISITGALLTFRDAGIQASIDDFGTGYSSLSYLKKFDIDYLKIDQSFVRNMATDHSDLVLCEAIIVMAHKLDMKVIAEGVETEQQRDLLVTAGCDYAQGYLYSRPVPPGDFEILLRNNTVRRG